MQLKMKHYSNTPAEIVTRNLFFFISPFCSHLFVFSLVSDSHIFPLDKETLELPEGKKPPFLSIYLFEPPLRVSLIA